MQAVEFQAIVKEGKIQIPDEYKQELQDDEQVKVINLINNKQQRNWKIMDKLAKNPISVKGHKQLTRDEIHDQEPPKCVNCPSDWKSGAIQTKSACADF